MTAQHDLNNKCFLDIDIHVMSCSMLLLYFIAASQIRQSAVPLFINFVDRKSKYCDASVDIYIPNLMLSLHHSNHNTLLFSYIECAKWCFEQWIQTLQTIKARYLDVHLLLIKKIYCSHDEEDLLLTWKKICLNIAFPLPVLKMLIFILI